jgi:hypothetical protein
VTMSAAVEASADALDALVQLLEQYCHPSNTGPWSSELAVFLRHGVHYFMKVGQMQLSSKKLYSSSSCCPLSSGGFCQK